MTVVVRAALEADAPAIARIYNEGISERVATFETELRRTEDILVWIAEASRWPLLVTQVEDGVAGWARVSRYSGRPAYAGVGEYTLYVDRTHRRRGLGRVLLEATCGEWERRGGTKLYGRLFNSNRASIELAHECGFRDVGIHQRHAKLDGEWKDVLLVERLLGGAASTVP